MPPWVDQELTSKIIAAAIEVHRYLGPGLLEVVYQVCLAAELEDRGLKYQREVVVPLVLDGKDASTSLTQGKALSNL